MNNEILNALAEEGCPSLRYRTRKEILESGPDISDYLDEIVTDKRVRYVATWRKEDGFLGDSFHGGWIPEVKMKYFGTGAEGALRFLAEMGVPANYPLVENCLDALLKDKWRNDKFSWSEVYLPELGLFGENHVRAVVFSRFGIEEHDFIRIEIQRAFDTFSRVLNIHSMDDITGTFQNKPYYNSGIVLPDSYHLKLLAFTHTWRNRKNEELLAAAIGRLVDLSPFPHIYIKYRNQRIAPAEITPRNLKQSPRELDTRDWFWWMHTMELFARMGIVPQVAALKNQVLELKEILDEGDGFFPFRPYSRNFEVWGVYPGLALEESWKGGRWKYDMTFRSLLILKYSGFL